MAEEESELDMGTDHLAERNYQMIEVLMTRLQKMEAKVEERRRACEDDQNADSAKCSSMLTSLQQDGDEADGELKAAGGESLAQSMFGARGDGGAAAADGEMLMELLVLANQCAKRTTLPLDARSLRACRG